MNHFLHKFNQRDGREVAGFTARAVDAMLATPGRATSASWRTWWSAAWCCPDGGAIDTAHLFVGGEETTTEWHSLNRDGSLRQQAHLPEDLTAAGDGPAWPTLWPAA
jgi:hypothetical protein